MKNILSFFQHRFPEIDILIHIHLRGGCLCAVCHRLIKLIKRNRLAQIIKVFFSVQEKVEADIMNITSLKMLFRKICCGITAKNKVTHGFLLH